MAPKLNRKRKSSEDHTTLPSISKAKIQKSPDDKYSTNGINRLPFDCFFIIFFRFPLRTLIPLRRVSHTWNENITEICARKEHLTLAPYSQKGPYWENENDLSFMDDLSGYVDNRSTNRHDYLEFRFPRSIKKCKLTEMFNNLTDLRIHFDCNCAPTNVFKLEKLLQSFACKQLQTFSFWFTAEGSLVRENVKFLPSLYKMFERNLITDRFPALKKLDLCITYNYNLDSVNVDLANSIMGQLERLSFNFYTKVECVEPMLAKLGPNLSDLSLNCGLITAQEHQIFDRVQFQDSLTHLRLHNIHIDESVNILQFACDRFASLTFVQLDARVLTDWLRITKLRFDHKWMKQLAKLSQLDELRLHDFWVNRFDHNDSSIVSSLPLVRKLTWCSSELLNHFSKIYCANQQFDGELFCVTLARQFPNAQQLTIVSGNLYSSKNGDNEAVLGEQVRVHVRRAFVHLRKSVFDFTAPEFFRRI